MRRLVYEFLESCRIAAAQIRSNRLRSFLTALGVIIGILAITLMGAAIGGIERGVDRSLAVIGDDVLYVNKWPWRNVEDWWNYRNRRNIQAHLADRLNELIASSPNTLFLRAVPADSIFSSVLAGGNRVDGIFTLGITHELSLLTRTDLREGRLFDELESHTARDVIVLGFDVADALFPNRSALGESVEVRGRRYEVIGVIQRQGSFLGLWSWDSMVGIPLSTFRKNIAVDNNAEIRVKLRPGADLEEARLELTGLMRRVRGLTPEARDDFEINDQSAIRGQLDPVKRGVAAAGLFITGLSLFVGAIGIMNITYVSVKERTREIGTRKALGARRRTILLQFLIEAVSICVLGGVAGLVLAWGLFQGALLAFPTLPATFPPGLILLSLSVSVMTGVVSGFAPAWSASRLDPVEALRYE